MQPLLFELGGEAFADRVGAATGVDFCRWKYFENPAGNAVVGIALDSENIVSIVAAVPKKLQIGSQIQLSFEMGDFITAEAYRRQGLFSRLIELVSQEATERGGSLAY